jgi:hypothetical protein
MCDGCGHSWVASKTTGEVVSHLTPLDDEQDK